MYDELCVVVVGSISISRGVEPFGSGEALGVPLPISCRSDFQEVVVCATSRSTVSKLGVAEMSYRFKEGEEIYCRVDTGWVPGTIIKTNPANNLNGPPYRIRLKSGMEVFAPK